MQELEKLIYKGEKIDVECKKEENSVPKSVYESYSAFSNTKGGYIVLGVEENKQKKKTEERFIIQGVNNPQRQIEDFWNTINGNKVNSNILVDDDVFIVQESGVSLIVIHVPRADYKQRPIYVGENPYKGTFKRNNEGDYHATEHEVKGMIRDQNLEGNDGIILEHYTMDDIDKETLKKYRQIFEIRNEEHVWNSLDDKSFLEKLGGYRKDRRNNKEGLTMAGLLMFGDGLAIRDEFDNIFMDYRNESEITEEIRWNDRVTYDGTWENNLFNFFTKVTPKLVEDLKKPFRLEGIQRIDETSVHKAVREAFVNLIIHADYLLDAGTLKIIKRTNYLEFSNPGILKLPIEDIYQGGNSKPRNPRMQTMLRLIGFGDNAGSGFPAILSTWQKEGWIMPKLVENTRLNQVTLYLILHEEKNITNFNYNNDIKISGARIVSENMGEYDIYLESMSNIEDQQQKRIFSYQKLVEKKLKPRELEKMTPIITFFKNKDKLTRTDVEKICGVSSSTALNYINRLIEIGVIKKNNDSVAVSYELVK